MAQRSKSPHPASEYRLVAWLFLRALALIYLAAFWSLATQVQGLAGSHGIYPVAEQLDRMAGQFGQWAPLAYPSVFWAVSADWALSAAAWGGCFLAVLVFLAGWRGGRWERALLILLYLLYLSLYHAGQYFTNFQWDYLLLEAGFLAILLPGGARPVVWLFRWLLFRLRLLSGLSKLLSGDPSWVGLTAISHYFETQPLPHAGAWYAHQLPDWLLRVGTGATLAVEILVPFMMLMPRRWRLLAAALTILWQLLIILTSNHNFFNLLTIVLCLFLLDDQALRRLMPASLCDRARRHSPLSEAPSRVAKAAVLTVALLVVPVSLIEAAGLLPGLQQPRWAVTLSHWLGQYRIANAYHVFPTIERERIEIQISASQDGHEWRPLQFRYWPVPEDRIAPLLVPHQPRLDWMMWFVPIDPVFLDWLERFLQRLLEGEPAVQRLIAAPPFDGSAPRLLRLDVYRYRFTTPEDRSETGNWWHRDYLGPFWPLPSVSADAGGATPAR